MLGLWHGGHGAQERWLSRDQEAELKAKAGSGEIRTIQAGVEWMKHRYGVEYSYWGMRWIFDRLALRPKVARLRSPQAAGQQQEVWKKGG